MSGNGGRSKVAGRKEPGAAASGKRSALDKRAAAREIVRQRQEGGVTGGTGGGKNVLQAVESPTGELTFKTAKPRRVVAGAEYYAIKSGAENGVTFGIKWENVTEVRGATAAIADTLTGKGFVKQGDKWVRRKG
jgi:hypothetical protein